MTKAEAQELLDIVYNDKLSQEEREQAYRRLTELFSVLLAD